MRSIAAVLLVTCVATGAHAQSAASDTSAREWTLASGGVTYRLKARQGRVLLDYFGPGEPTARWDSAGARYPSEEFDGFMERPGVATPAMRLVRAETLSTPATRELRLTMRHAALPLEVEARYAAWGETGVFTRRLVVRNRADRPFPLESAAPLLAWNLPTGEWTMRTLWGGWGQERQLATERVAHGTRRFEQTFGRSSRGFVPWLSLRDEGRGVEYVAELAWSGNWWMEVERHPEFWSEGLHDRPVQVRMGLRHDFGGALSLAPGESLELPAVAMTAARGDLDDATNRMHRWQREHVVPRAGTARANDPPLVQFNSWYPFNDRIDVATLKRNVDAAAELGAEAYVLDSGWYSEEDWARDLGDYRVNRRKFPRGLEELSEHVRRKGMKFGLWVEIENAGLKSDIYRQHPEWCLSYLGKPASLAADRCPLDFAKPEVRAWATAIVDRLVRDYRLGWIKIDYNVDVGDRFDPSAGGHAGGRLHDHVAAYYAWLDELRARHPDLVVENCASGGLRFDVGIMAHAHTTWVSDRVDPVASLSLRYGCSVQFTPGVCNHWMVGDTDRGEVKPGGAPGWHDFMFRVAMNGQFGISSRAHEWDAALRERGRANVALYKRVRGTIAAGDVYHLTPPPAAVKPTGWMAIQYVADGGRRSVVTAYRLAEGSERVDLRIRGLRPDATYEVRENGEPKGSVTGEAIMKIGLRVSLAEEWRASVLELTAIER
jgi:alpha-galactosidase